MAESIMNLPFFTDEHRVFHASLDQFMRREAPIEYDLELELAGRYPHEAMEKLAKLGYLGVNVPEEHGGQGLDTTYMALMVETMARHCQLLALAYGMMTWGIFNMIRYGTPEQRARYIPRTLRGEQGFAVGITEPNVGADAASIALRAERRGDDYILNGEKIFISAAHVKNTAIILFTRTDSSVAKHQGITAFLVPNDIPGLEIRRLKIMSRNAPGVNQLFFKDARIPASWMLGELNGGWKIMTSHLDWERIMVAATYNGISRTATDIAIRYAKERKQFGHPIGHFQAIKHILADMDTETELSRLLAYNAAYLHANKLATTADVARAKMVSCDTIQRVTTNGMQVLGAYGQIPEYHMERFFRIGKIAPVGGGSAQIMHSVIAKELGLR